MKTLQNNFTTPGQSKRLLELGVPADSADCFYSNILGNWYLDIIPQHKNYTCISNGMDDLYLPCWSVGRLMEIWDICGNACESVTAKRDDTRVELLVKLYEENAAYADFSKLEEQL